MDGGSNAKRCRAGLAGPASVKTWFGTPRTGVTVRSGPSGPVPLRCLGGVTPRHQLVEPSDFVPGDPSGDSAEPGLRGDAVALRPAAGGGGFRQFVPARHFRGRATGTARLNAAAPRHRHQNGISATEPCIINASLYAPLGTCQPAYWGCGAQAIRLPSLAHFSSF